MAALSATNVTRLPQQADHQPKRQFPRDTAPVSGYLMAPRRERRYKPLPMMRAPLYCAGATSSDRFTTNYESDKAYL
jgi:hypothetical protein